MKRFTLMAAMALLFTGCAATDGPNFGGTSVMPDPKAPSPGIYADLRDD